MRILGKEIDSRSVFGILGTAAIVGAGAYCLFNSQERARVAERQEEIEGISNLCEAVKKRFDANNNFMLEPEEGAAMARALGYEKVFPTTSLVFQLGYYSTDENYTACLRMSSQGSTVDGFASGNPVFDDRHWISRSILKSACHEQTGL